MLNLLEYVFGFEMLFLYVCLCMCVCVFMSVLCFVSISCFCWLFAQAMNSLPLLIAGANSDI